MVRALLARGLMHNSQQLQKCLVVGHEVSKSFQVDEKAWVKSSAFI